MPGFTTHYLFGLNAYQHMDNLPLKKNIRKNHTAYGLGLQGPDIFFYNLPSLAIYGKNIGSVTHSQNTGLFLYHLINSRKIFYKNPERQIAESYIAGFWGHYILDTHCHPYIYHKSGFTETNSRYHGKHMALETDIDAALLRFYKHCPPSAFRQSSTISLTPLQSRTIAACLYYAYKKTFPNLHISYGTILFSIYSMRIGTACLRDVSGRKKAWIQKPEKLFLGYPLVSSLIPSDTLSSYDDPLNTLHSLWKNPWESSSVSNDSFCDLMEKAQEQYLQISDSLNLLFYDGLQMQEETACIKKLLKMLGNKSYHSGLTLPSA